ncbi:MAG TPA: glycoside hydrolase family 16 protein [Alphaproteobacteria bacterium]|nr:glycoside hydrolase family 16 protein [Alphaproteobacteria bacterium]
MKLSLDDYYLTFEETFKTLDISAHGPRTRWIAHTPWHGDFGDAIFTDPRAGFPFTINDDGLQIEAHKGADGKWRSGLICSMDKDGAGQHGFAQQFGYFEMRARLPDGPGVWPAFWLIGTDKSRYSSEIDVMEYYGAFPGYYHVTTHVWRKTDGNAGSDKTIAVPPHSLCTQLNDFGVSIDDNWTVFFLNRTEVQRWPTLDEFKQPMYMLANLALGGGWPIRELTSPQYMQIRHMRAYQKKA